MKVLFALVSCHKNAARRQAQRDTWLPNMKSDYKYFLGNGNSELKEDEVQLDVPDNYESLVIKVREIFKYALEQGYEHICKADDDVYLFPERLLQSDFYQYPYVGRLNKWRTPLHPKSFVSGFTYWVNAEAAKMVVDAPIDASFTFEDRWVGGVLGRAGIEGHNDRLYKALSLLPRHQWHTAVRQDYGSFAEFSPEELRYVHGLITSTVSPPTPPIRPMRGNRLCKIQRRWL